MATLNNFNLKKGDIIFLFGNWNGNEKETVDFYIQQYTVHSIGKKRCYLLYNNDINSRKEYSCNRDINAALTLEEAIEKCKVYQVEYTEEELKNYKQKITNYSGEKKYVENIKKASDNLMYAKQRILVNPYSTDKPITL